MEDNLKNMISFENSIKLGTLMGSVFALYFAIKSDIRELSTEKHYEVEHLQYQITELKDCCNGKGGNKHMAFKQSYAIVPNSIEIENEK